MSKKNKKSKKIVVENQAEQMMTRDSEGFMTLKPTSIGEEKLKEITKRKSKVSEETPYQPEAPKVEKVPYDPKPMSEMLDELEDLVKAGKYGKGLDVVNQKTITAFVNELNTREADSVSEEDKTLFGMARKLLAIGKSYYEYDSKSREIISNKTYDDVLALYLKTGGIEPVGIIPKGLKELKKVGIKYHTLHNNVDKAYILHEDDTIPEGVKETDSVEAFLKRMFKETGTALTGKLRIEMSPKIDGVSLNGTIHDDMLIDPQTRGDEDESVFVMGVQGMQVTNGFKAESDFGIQYEAFVTKEDSVKASEYLGLNQAYVSCRHAASGLIHRLATMEDDKLLQFISLYPITSEGLDGTYEERMDYLSNFGIVPKDMPKRRIVSGNFDQLMKHIQSYYEDLEERREKLSFTIDGMVITAADDDDQNALGRSGRTNKYQIAMKFNPMSAIATVSGITLDSGNKGYRTIQVQLKHPIYLDGVEYNHVPMLSIPLFEDLGLRVGSKVNVHRVGDVIPAISMVEEGRGSKIRIPDSCPCCGKRLTLKNKKLYCSNLECTDNIVGLFTHFFEAMGLTGYSDAFSETLVKQLKCTNLAHVLKITEATLRFRGVKSEMILNFPAKLKEAISKHRDYEILGAMGLPGVGPAKAKILLEKLNDMPREKMFMNYGPKLRAACAAAVGEEQADSLECYLIGPLFCCSWVEMVPLITNVTKDFSKVLRVGHTGGDLSEKTKEIIRANGFDIVDGKSFDILITSSMSRTTGKMEAAKKKNLPIFLEEDFCARYGQVMQPAV